MNLTDTTLSPIRKGIVGVQFLFVAFGATVLVPLLVGLDPSTALFTAGIGTLIFHLVSKGKVPIFLGSSFAFIAPIIKATELYGLSGTLFGLSAHLPGQQLCLHRPHHQGHRIIRPFRNTFRTDRSGIGLFRHECPSQMAGPIGHQPYLPAGRDRSRHHPHRYNPGRHRRPDGRRELGTGPDLAGHSRHCILESQRPAQTDPHLLRNRSRLSGCPVLL